MSLTDVDKNSGNRNQPQINASDKLADSAVKAHATDGIAYRAEETSTAPRVVTKDDQLIVYDGSNNKILIGRDGNGNYVMKVAKDGFDVLTASDDELNLNSGQNAFKVAKQMEGSFTLTSGASTATTTLTLNHNLGYEPLVFPTVSITTNGVSGGQTGIFNMPYILTGTGGGTTNVFVILAFVKLLRVTSTSMIFEIGVQGASLTLAGTITAYILQETAN